MNKCDINKPYAFISYSHKDKDKDIPLSPLDKDMLDYLENNNLYDRFLLNVLGKENLSYEDINIAHKAIMSFTKDEIYSNLSVVQADKCDQNLLGYISDALIRIAGITIAIVLTHETEKTYRLSVRSCDSYIKADSIIKYITEGIGGGGGSTDKSGGIINKINFREKYPNYTIRSYIEIKLIELYNRYIKLESGVDDIPEILKENLSEYESIPNLLRYLKVDELFEENDQIRIRSLEGDIITQVKDTYIVIGLEGEIYSMSKQKFEDRYEEINSLEIGEEDCDNVLRNLDYTPTIKSIKYGTEKGLRKEH